VVGSGGGKTRVTLLYHKIIILQVKRFPSPFVGIPTKIPKEIRLIRNQVPTFAGKETMILCGGRIQYDVLEEFFRGKTRKVFLYHKIVIF
jgi:hypothetical protein